MGVNKNLERTKFMAAASLVAFCSIYLGCAYIAWLARQMHLPIPLWLVWNVAGAAAIMVALSHRPKCSRCGGYQRKSIGYLATNQLYVKVFRGKADLLAD